MLLINSFLLIKQGLERSYQNIPLLIMLIYQTWWETAMQQILKAIYVLSTTLLTKRNLEYLNRKWFITLHFRWRCVLCKRQMCTWNKAVKWSLYPMDSGWKIRAHIFSWMYLCCVSLFSRFSLTCISYWSKAGRTNLLSFFITT